MVYSSLSNEELERWIHSSPEDLMAKVELLRRAPGFVVQQSAEIVELNRQLNEQSSYVEGLKDTKRYLEDQLKGFLTV